MIEHATRLYVVLVVLVGLSGTFCLVGVLALWEANAIRDQIRVRVKALADNNHRSHL